MGCDANVSDPNANRRIAIGYQSVSDTDRHCVIGGPSDSTNSIECIKAGSDVCDLGATDRKFADAHLNGTVNVPDVKCDVISPLTAALAKLLVDDLTVSPLPYGGTLFNNNAAPGYPIHNVGAGFVQLTTDSGLGQNAKIQYSDVTVLNAIKTTSFYCKFTGYLTDSGIDGQGLYFFASPTIDSELNAPDSYVVVWRSQQGKIDICGMVLEFN